MSIQLNSVTGSNDEASRNWLGALLLQRGAPLMPRLVSYYRELARRPRPWRRQLRRKLAVTLSGAALLLALAGPIAPARADLAAPDVTIQVVNGEVADLNNGKCSLVEAIWNARSANANNMKADCTAGNTGGADTVALPNGGNFVLTAAHNEQFGPTGLPVITSAVTLQGNGSTISRVADNGTPFRILAVDAAGSLTLRNTTLSNGFLPGWSYQDGGAILSYGNLVIEGSTIANSSAYTGGGIRATTATITGSRIIDNTANATYGGLGGGILADSLTLIDSTVAGNIADGGEEWEDTGGGIGGGISMGDGSIIRSTISGNQATHGSDSQNYNEPLAGQGGGIAIDGTVTIVNSTISRNEANLGGGLFVSGDVTLNNTTITGNTARIHIGGYGFDVVTGGYGGGVYVNAGSEECGTATLRGALIGGNTAVYLGYELFVEGDNTICTPNATANAFNVFGHNGEAGLYGLSAGATDVVPTVGLAAILSPLANNGGPTQTHALPAGSPALDLAPNAQCTAAPVNGVDQRGEPRNQNGAGGATNNECDAGSYELQAGGGGAAFLVSPTGSGTVGGVAFAPADILKYDAATGWSMYFDGSDVGVTKNLSAFEVLGNGDVLMSFAANQAIPGVGTFAPQDVARFDPTSTGPNTAGAFAWELDGSTRFLSTSGEKIDALGDVGDGRLALSTSGAAAVQLPNGSVLKAQDEDALGLNRATQAWSAYFDGTPIPGLKGEDVNALWIDPATGDLYISIVGAFNLGGVAGNGKDIVKLTKSGGSYTPSLWWDGSVEGFPSNVDGLEIVP